MRSYGNCKIRFNVWWVTLGYTELTLVPGNNKLESRHTTPFQSSNNVIVTSERSIDVEATPERRRVSTWKGADNTLIVQRVLFWLSLRQGDRVATRRNKVGPGRLHRISSHKRPRHSRHLQHQQLEPSLNGSKVKESVNMVILKGQIKLNFNKLHVLHVVYFILLVLYAQGIWELGIWELGEFSKVQKFQSMARMLTIHLSVNSDGFSCTMPSD